MKHNKLNQFYATAISGNDILSSALYVSGIAIIYSGMLAPLVLLLIAGVLFMYKSIYTEVVEALPVNGGAYNCLLNSTSKTFAAIAGITTLLSYVATAVISAKTGVAYLQTIIPVPVLFGTVCLLLLFAFLVVMGIRDSAKVATAIFAFHVLVLVSFVIFGIKHDISFIGNFVENWHYTTQIIHQQGNILKVIFIAFAASLLGVSGFESSANFVEEQDKGVFRKTLRNMLAGVAIFNPLIALVILGAMPHELIVNAKDFILSNASLVVAGPFFQKVLVIDAFLVLSGAVLTAYVGVSGLISRMSADNCLPAFFARQNSKGAHPVIISVFFVLCASILLLTHGDLLSLAGVYAIAFLGVMSMFALGNIVLKQTRPDLKRTYSAPLFFVIPAFLATFLGIVGNINIDQRNLYYFALYFVPALLVIFMVLYQDRVIKVLLRVSKNYESVQKFLHKHFDNLIKGEIVVFLSGTNRLFQILEYIHDNEHARNVTLVHCEPVKNDIVFKEVEETLGYLSKAHVFPELKLTVIHKDMTFGPEAIDKISQERDVRKNMIFIGSLHEWHSFDYDQLGGVRIIF